MNMLATRVKNAERMMTYATATKDGIELTFADGCKGLIPFSDIPEIGNLENLASIELPNPYLVNIHSSKKEAVELPWDFVRHYCDSSYKPREIALAAAGMQSLGKRIATMRKAAGMTQAELAKAAGIGRVTQVRIERGEQSPRYETLMMIAKALGRPAAELLVG
ncbi:MAG: helix-turn-helix transcriptional regulator [Dehalococcoidales bacterium]|nr:helix-turn-helix transcriptional regulator [Dehalococcoidales bacterium]